MRRAALVWTVALLGLLAWSGANQAPWGSALAALTHASTAVAHQPAAAPLAFEPASLSQVFDPFTDVLATLIGLLAPMALGPRRRRPYAHSDPTGPAPRMLHLRGFTHAFLLDGG